MLNLPDYQFIFPNAPFPHPQVPWGRAWYALESPEYQGLSESREMLKDWLQSLESVTSIPLDHTILSGFSQGGAMTLDVGLTLPFAGLCVLSGFLHSQPQTNETTPPVLIVHGKQDQVVPLEAAHKAKKELIKLGVNLEYHEFNMGHEIAPEVLPVIESFILKYK
jgi:phospholipase/carboxylesterase